MRARSVRLINLIASEVQNWLESVAYSFGRSAAFLQALNFDFLRNNLEHIDSSDLKRVWASFGDDLFNFEGLEWMRQKQLVLHNMVIEGDIVFTQVWLKEVKVREIVVGDGGSTQYETYSAHALLALLIMNITIINKRILSNAQSELFLHYVGLTVAPSFLTVNFSPIFFCQYVVRCFTFIIHIIHNHRAVATASACTLSKVTRALRGPLFVFG